MNYRITGGSAFGFGIDWAKNEGDFEVARQAVTFLEDRRILFGDRHLEDELYCVRSAIEARARLTHLIATAKPGKGLEGALRQMRAHFRRFVELAGPDAVNYRGQWRGLSEANPFGLALGELRSGVGIQLAVILSAYPLEIEPDLARILPPSADEEQDLSWIPGFDSA